MPNSPHCVFPDMACDYYCLPSLLDLSLHWYGVQLVVIIMNHLQFAFRNDEFFTASVAPDIFPQQQSCTLFPRTSKMDFVADLQSAELLVDHNWQLLSIGDWLLS